MKELHRTGRNRNFTLGGCVQGPVHTRTQGKKAVTPIRDWARPTCWYWRVLHGGGWVAVAHCRDKDTGSSGAGEYTLV